MAGRLVAAAEPDTVRCNLGSRVPARIVEIGLGPVRSEPARVVGVGRHTPDAGGGMWKLLPRIRIVRTPRRIADEPMVLAEASLEDQGPGTERRPEGCRSPPWVRASEVTGQNGNHVSTLTEERRQVDQVIVQPPWVRTHRTACHLGAVHPQYVARVRREPCRDALGHRCELETPPEPAPRGNRVGAAREWHVGREAHRGRLAPDPARAPAPSGEIGGGDLVHDLFLSRFTAWLGGGTSLGGVPNRGDHGLRACQEPGCATNGPRVCICSRRRFSRG
jgi:hypothetical protein